MNRSLGFFLALLFLFCGAMVFWYAARARKRAAAPPGEVTRVKKAKEDRSQYQAQDLADEELIKQFRLTRRDEAEFSAEELKGHPWVGSFFYSTCPHECRKQNQQMKELHAEFAEKGVKFLSITCDPRADTAARLQKYALDFTSDAQHWLFLTGDLEYIRRVGRALRVSVHEQSHTRIFVVVDKWGQIRGHFNWKDPLKFDAMRKLLGELAAESKPPTAENAEKPAVSTVPG